MTSDRRDLHDCTGAISDWENEGGAPAAMPSSHEASECALDDMLRKFGQSVVTHWNELPHKFKQTVFREIVSGRGGPDTGLKARAARYLHENGPQTFRRNTDAAEA